MTSPVDTSVKWFSSDMLGSPALKGQVGSLIALLDACLVNGWGIQTATSCVVAGGVCTLTFPLDHAALPECVVLVAGASIADLNGEQKITAVAPNVLKFATAAVNGTATGTITAKMAPAGWEKKFTGTNLAVYKSLDVQSNGQFLRINDTNAVDARACGYETMTAVSTGTLLFPTAVQMSGGLYWEKAQSATANPIDWVLVGDARRFYFMPCPYMSDTGYEAYKSPGLCFFGDTVNWGNASDPFNTLIIGGTAARQSYGAMYRMPSGSTGYLPKISAGTGTAQIANTYLMGTSDSQDQSYDRHSGEVRVSPVLIKTGATNSWRAKMPGACIGNQSYMEVAFPWRSVISLLPDTRNHLALLIVGSTSSLSDFYLMTLDITGPWGA